MVRWKGMTMVAAAFGLCAGPLSAATWSSWSGGNNCLGSAACDSAITSNFGNTRTGTSGSTSITVTASAWSFTGSTSNTTLENAYLSLWSGGLGVTNRDYSSDPELGSPNHALDNANRNDYILFRFNAPAGTLINLSSITAGWVSSDADITVLAYTGTGTPTLGNKTRSNLLSDGWQLVGHYGCSNLGCSSASEPQTINLNTTVASNYWLLGAYDASSTFANAAKTFGSPNASPYDYLKIASISGTPTTQVPEPGSAALVGGALLAGLWALRRSRGRALLGSFR